VKSDRRAQTRQKISSLTYVELGGGNGGIALNVSEGGMTVVAAQPLDAEGILEIALQLPQTRKRLELKGEVRWMSDSHKEAGIRFIDLTVEQLEDIRGWMEREAAPPPMEDIAALPSLRDTMKPRESNFQFEDEDEVADEAPLDVPDEPTVVAKIEERPRVAKPEINISIPASVVPPAAPAVVSAAPTASVTPANSATAKSQPAKPSGPRKFERVYEEGHREEPPAPPAAASAPVTIARSNGKPAANVSADEIVTRPASSPAIQVPPSASSTRPSARTPFSAMTSDAPAAQAEESTDPEIVERVLETTAALSAATNASRAQTPPLSLGIGPASSLELPRQTSFGSSLRAGDSVLTADDGSKDYRIHLQSGWVLALLVLLLAAVSFVSGMAVRRGALNRVLGESDGSTSAKSGAAGASTTPAQTNGAAAPAPTAPAKPVDLEIVDSSNRRWVIPAQAGGTVAPPSTTSATPAVNGTAPDTTTGGADGAGNTAPQPSGEASNGTRTVSNVDLSDATTTDAANGGLLIALPDTPISASSMVAISVRRFIPVPPDAAAKNRNLQLGAVANPAVPIYPADAMTQNVEGIVRLRATIAPDGNVQALEVQSGPKPLMTASLTAVRNWRYNPTLLNGKPIETQAEITLVYRLPR
jgi:TonB family protein